jgi:hypothetical protein
MKKRKGQLASGRPRDRLLSVSDNSGLPPTCMILIFQFEAYPGTGGRVS